MRLIAFALESTSIFHHCVCHVGRLTLCNSENGAEATNLVGTTQCCARGDRYTPRNVSPTPLFGSYLIGYVVIVHCRCSALCVYLCAR